jgi:predicted nucleotidyltransferase
MWPRIPPTIVSVRVRDAWAQTIKRIATTYHPRRVILFGSQARGDADPDSDVDLLVVFDDERDGRERRVGIRRLLGDAPFAKDVLVARWAAHRGRPASTEEGIVVYERCR